jgi:hypothetical protein
MTITIDTKEKLAVWGQILGCSETVGSKLEEDFGIPADTISRVIDDAIGYDEWYEYFRENGDSAE